MGVLISNIEIQNLTELLSDIRSLAGVTTVRNEDLVNFIDQDKTRYKTKLSIKIDPFPYKGQKMSNEEIINRITGDINKMDSVRSFVKKSFKEKEDTPKITTPIPVKSIEDIQEILKFKIKK